MTDTSARMAARMLALYRGLPGWRRLEMGCDMFDCAKTMALAGIRTQAHGSDAKTIRRLLFLRLYAGDFPPEKRRRILACLENTA